MRKPNIEVKICGNFISVGKTIINPRLLAGIQTEVRSDGVIHVFFFFRDKQLLKIRTNNLDEANTIVAGVENALSLIVEQ